MAAFDVHEFTTPPDDRQDTYANRVSGTVFSFPGTSPQSASIGPIPYCLRYAPSGSVSFLYIQTERVLVSSGSMTTTSNYTITGTSAPSVSLVTFTTGKSYIRLSLSGLLTLGAAYTLTVKDNTFNDGYASNIGTPIPVFIDYPVVGSGISQTVALGSPVMSHT